MSIENRLRKFKLIDTEDYPIQAECNPNIFAQYFKEDNTVVGSIDKYGSLRNITDYQVLISKGEFEFFEEILHEKETPAPEESLYWQENTPLEAGLIVGKKCCGEKEFTVKYAGRETVMLEASNGEESTAQRGHLKSLIKSDKEVMFEKVLSVWKSKTLDNGFDGKRSTVNLESFFDTVYSVMKGE